jgi:ADP-ribosyl-[dinitrogen reductase] hydrolase
MAQHEEASKHGGRITYRDKPRQSRLLNPPSPPPVVQQEGTAAGQPSKSTTVVKSHHTIVFLGLRRLSIGTTAAAATTVLVVAFSFLFSIPPHMRLFGISRPRAGLAAATSLVGMPPADNHIYRPSRSIIESALYAFFAGDALSSPTHWFYGGFPQIQQYYGPTGITGYTKPVLNLPGSILNKSNLAGGGRATPRDKVNDPIIGQIINHDKAQYWDPNKNIHYHATLQAGEPTLEAQLARVLMQSIVANAGRFNADHFRRAYVHFMTTPNSHNDTYASTCHRMFFANYYYRKLDPTDCPDNDRHNVDTIDGLVLPTITALAVAGRRDGTLLEARTAAAATAAVTRKSDTLSTYAAAWGQLIYRVVREQVPPATAADEMRRELRLTSSNNLMTACYLDSAVPSLLAMISDDTTKQTPVWQSLLHNANIGGENVHRGSCLGAILGAVGQVGDDVTAGLFPQAAIAAEVIAFAAAVVDDDDNNESSMVDGSATAAHQSDIVEV